MTTIKNLTNSPHDLDTINGRVTLPAMGKVKGEFTPAYLEALKGIGYFEVVDGAKAKKVDPVALADLIADDADLIDVPADEPTPTASYDDMSDDDLRSLIAERGLHAHHRAGRAKLIEVLSA